MKRVFFLVGFTVVSLLFFASDIFAADGFAEGVTGGAGGTVVIVDSNAAELESYAGSDSTYIIQVLGTIDLSSIGGKLHIKSNKTIKGIGSNPTIIGDIAFQSSSSNVIIEELNITNPSGLGEGDGITVKYATHIFITKCTFYDCPDGCLDITRESDYVTVSWCKFYYTAAFSHRYVNLVGGGDSHTGDRGKLHITFHHNWWSTYCYERMPRVRFGRVHVYNNYYGCSGNDYCVGVGVECGIRLESNYFDHIEDAWENYSGSGIQGLVGWNSGNKFMSTPIPWWAPNDYATIFTPPYAYTLDDGADVKNIVMAGAGAGMGPTPRRINPLDGACGVSTDVVLGWATEPNADSYDLYFGTSFNDVNDATTDSAEYMGRYDANSYHPGELEEDTTYYWRIDDVNLSDPCSPYKGDVWTFTTVKVYYVDAEATGNNDGSSWYDAFNHLQDALSVAWRCDEIRVAEGVYKPDEDTAHPDGSGERDATFELINGLAIYGGFPSGGGQWHERDPNAYKTILSGDLMDNDGPNFANNGENSYHVVTGSGTDATAVLDGFIITAGNANGDEPYFYGGGMLNEGGSPTLTNCTFSRNWAMDSGGAMLNISSSPTLTNCTFSDNSTPWAGGGMDNSDSSNPTLANCTFSGNSAEVGGGMVNYASCSPKLTNCTFSGNSAGDAGGGMWNDSSSPTVKGCAFSNNSAIYGGGMFNHEYSSPMVESCTFSGNLAKYRGGGMVNYNSSQTLTNSILWGNTAPNGAQIYKDGTSSVTVNYSDVQGGWPGTGNINSDPLFIDANNGDLRLLLGSPCINAGDPNFVAEPNETDLDGLPRIIGGRIDMGAYEFNHRPIAVAGPNQVAYAWIDGIADVNLDGSGSYDDDNDPLDYYWSWTIDGNDYEANGVNPTIELPVGEHTIELVVNDGLGDSEPDYVDVNVIAPLEAKLCIIPRVVNRSDHLRNIMAIMELPTGIKKADVKNEPFVLYPADSEEGIEASRQYVYTKYTWWCHRASRVEAVALFSKNELMDAIPDNGRVELQVVGQLKSGRYFYGSDTIRIIGKHKHWWDWWDKDDKCR